MSDENKVPDETLPQSELKNITGGAGGFYQQSSPKPVPVSGEEDAALAPAELKKIADSAE